MSAFIDGTLKNGPKLAKSMKRLLMLLRKTAVFCRFSEWRLLMIMKMTRAGIETPNLSKVPYEVVPTRPQA